MNEKMPLNEDEEGASSDTSTEYESSNKKRKAANNANSPNSNKNKKKSKKEKKDLNFKESELQFNLFNLQAEGVLSEITVKQKYVTQFESWYKKFQAGIKTFKQHNEIKLSEVKLNNNKLAKHKFINSLAKHRKSSYSTDQDLVLKFLKPDGCEFRVKSLVGPQLVVNVSVIIPKSVFNEKDYLNNRYLVRKQFYLTYVYSELRKHFSELKYDVLKELITLHVSGKVLVHIDAIPAEDSFKLPRFEPDKNNVKENLFNLCSGVDANDLKDHGTPYINSVMMKSLRVNSNYAFIQNKLKGLKSVQDGLKLLTVWLKNHGLLIDNYGFCETLLLNTMVYLVQQNKVNNFMNVYQVLRSFWVFLSSTNWHENPISLCEGISIEKLRLFSSNFDVVFLDESGSYNLTSFVSLDFYVRLQREAQLALKQLDDTRIDPFCSLFITKMDVAVQYDAVLRLDDSKGFLNIFKSIAKNARVKYIGCFRYLVTQHIVKILKRALNQRVHCVVPFFDSDNLENELFSTLLFGITLNKSDAFSVIEKGPAGNSPEGAEFKKFWGTLSDVRRFADGSICEAVYFPANTLYDRREIFKKIIDFVVLDKLGVESYKIISNEFEHTLLHKTLTTSFPIKTSEEVSLKIVSTFNNLTKILRGFKLPLEITGVQGISGCFCYTDVFPPLPVNHKSGDKFDLSNEHSKMPPFVEPIRCALQLNLNSKWPNDLMAMRKLQTAFYLEMSKSLKESSINSQANYDFIDVLYMGLVYRLRVYNPKEISLLKRYTKPDGMVAFKDTEESLQLDKDLNILPKLIGSLNGLHSQNNSFGPSTCLIKRWLRSQLIDKFYIPDTVIDLLNASLFLNNGLNSEANLPQVAFLRFLKFFGQFDFNLQCVIVNFNNEITKEQMNEIEENFRDHRADYPAIYIVTPYDEQKSVFSKICSKEIVRRFSLLAQAAYKIVEDGILKQTFSFEDMYKSNWTGYNILIRINQALNTKRFQFIGFTTNNVAKIKEYRENVNEKMPIIGFNPVDYYLKDLRESYGDFALFFYDSYGGDTIGVLWQPKALQAKPFEETLVQAVCLENEQLILNKDAIIEDFYLLGKEIVNSIEVN